ncbi:probable E3 ubiquitin-protein ligase DTX2 isoform X1 [Erpetoichthys calabaricus]|uniref:E3 ubiquitin-protein ligase n=1 Tax=Erpetoichthys calabaricus TaxID=27687 RepID=A0A8C4X7R9_ERPCA|nr:probable E3 ubiquitin-protein ligase DTX2 isoform X1 [Erpetoichthys calabaricus]
MAVAPTTAAVPPQPLVAVWQWQDDMGRWRPYSGKVSVFIEQFMQQRNGGLSSSNSSISLGLCDTSLASYIIDVPSLKQFRQDTGKMRSVCRILYSQSGALGKGVTWEWANDEGGYTTYEMDICIFLEDSFNQHLSVVDLYTFGYDYTIDFTQNVQINKFSGFKRPIIRRVSLPYPAASAATGSVIHSGPACTCHQCLSNNVGPIVNRTRHSVGHIHINWPLHPGFNRTSTVAQSNTSFSPYPRRPLSVGHMAWGGPWTPGTTFSGLAGATQISSSSGYSVSSLPIQLNGPSNLNSALAGMTAILMSAAGLPVRFMHAPQPTTQASGKHAKKQRSVKRANKQSRKAPNPEEVIIKYMETVDTPPDENCIICMERLSCPSGYDEIPECKSISNKMVGRFKKCGHTLHLLCMLAMYNNGNKDGSLQCPSCKAIYGEKTGIQPKGNMDIYFIPQSLPGHPNSGTIHIVYDIPSGIQGPEHPKPGQPYSSRGFPRHCYLPDSDKGRKVLELLKVAWHRRLIFTIGTSSTTGETDTVVWNEIHHKTEMMSNSSGHGYPDPNYLDNVLLELAAQGVDESCLTQQ